LYRHFINYLFGLVWFSIKGLHLCMTISLPILDFTPILHYWDSFNYLDGEIS